MRDLQQMRTIQNNELEPSTSRRRRQLGMQVTTSSPAQGLTVTANPSSVKGCGWLAKQERRQAPLRKATVRQVVAAHKPDHKIDLALKSITILACITMAVPLLLATV